jgi:hypothetical protein
MKNIEMYQFKSILPSARSENDPEQEDKDQRTQRDEHEKDEAIEEYIDPGIENEEKICDPEQEEDLQHKKKSKGGSVTHG